MPERRGYHPPEEMSPEIEDVASVSATGAPKKFTRRHFLELAGATVAGAVIGSRIFGSKESADGSRRGPHEIPPQDNLPVEFSPEKNDLLHDSTIKEERGKKTDISKKYGKKKKEKYRKGRKKGNTKQQEIKEFWERFHAPQAGAVLEELRGFARNLDDKNRSVEALKLVDEIGDFEDAEVVRARLNGDAQGRLSRDYFKVLLKKPEVFLRVLARVADQHGVPLSVMLSVFSIEGAGRQTSKNRFQLGPDTARSLGLAVTDDKDERGHFEKSAHAAARYLKTLYGGFGNQWGLALSAYNAGASGLAHLITRYFKDAHYTSSGHGPRFAKEDLARLGINSATLYEKESAWLMTQNKKKRFELRALWYPFAAEALSQHGWRLLEEQQKNEIGKFIAGGTH